MRERERERERLRAQFDICLFDSHFKGDLENPIAGDLYPAPLLLLLPKAFGTL